MAGVRVLSLEQGCALLRWGVAAGVSPWGRAAFWPWRRLPAARVSCRAGVFSTAAGQRAARHGAALACCSQELS